MSIDDIQKSIEVTCADSAHEEKIWVKSFL